MYSIYVMVLLFAAGSTDGGVNSATVEFISRQACETALADLKAQHERAQRGRLIGGCYRKGPQ
jgi:hypothetical protein